MSSIHHTSFLEAAQNAYEMPLLTLNKPHDSHPSLGHLILLVFEAVLEVICVSLPGYIVARLGYFDAEKQKFLANLNVMLFTPCLSTSTSFLTDTPMRILTVLVFTKLASQLTPNKLVDLAIIPLIFVIQMGVSYLVSRLVSGSFRFNKRASNFVTAMGVFGNSNSLPISLVLSLSQTLKGLHWDKIPGDNDDDVGARGILYLLLFQQLGQLARWSWGYHVLLAPKETYPEYADDLAEEGQYRDDEPQSEGTLIPGMDSFDRSPSSEDFDRFEPAGRTPVTAASRASPAESEDEGGHNPSKKPKRSLTTLHGNNIPSDANLLPSPALTDGGRGDGNEAEEPGVVKAAVSSLLSRAFDGLPSSVQTILGKLKLVVSKVYSFLSSFMNPPLWAMLVAIIVASVPSLKELFFEEGSFVKNSVTSAIRSNGGVAVPLILVVLGANLANNTQQHANDDEEERRIGKKLLIASLVSRMVLPTLIMAPILAVIAKYVNVSILDDPIFIIVCFLLTGAPSALQLAQICQINNVYEGVMSNILFQSYVIWYASNPSALFFRVSRQS